MNTSYRPGGAPARPVALSAVIDIAQLMPPAEAPFDMPQHVRTLALLCGEALDQTSGAGNIMDGQPGHLFVLTRREGQEQIACRYAHLNQPGLAGQAEPLANLLDNVANQYQAGQGPLRREPGEEYLAVALIVRGFEIAPDAREDDITAERLHEMVAAGQAEMVMRGVGISADHYRAYTWLKPEQDRVQGCLLAPGEKWPESNTYIPMVVSLHERLSVD